MLDKRQLAQAIIEVLSMSPRKGMLSGSAINLLVLTAAHESRGGTYIAQLGGGPACGVFQMEPRTGRDLEKRLSGTDLGAWLEKLRGGCDVAYALRYRMDYAIAMARCYYWTFTEPLPAADDADGIASYWKKHWNTVEGKGTVEQALKDYIRYTTMN